MRDDEQLRMNDRPRSAQLYHVHNFNTGDEFLNTISKDCEVEIGLPNIL